jgi:SpoVK/Ycf46/Vps4 family AAA+-type ATPase
LAAPRTIKQIFRDARRYRVPTLILFDEFDSIIRYAGAGGNAASQAINAVAGIFKQEMNDLIEANPNVLVVATHGMTGADLKEVLRRVQLAKAMQDARTGGQIGPITQQGLIRSITELAQQRTG